jgi:hypothetical protein
MITDQKKPNIVKLKKAFHSMHNMLGPVLCNKAWVYKTYSM